MEEFTRSNVKDLRMEMDYALEEISKKYKIGITLEAFSYSSEECNVKVSFLCKRDENGKVMSKIEKDYIDQKDRLDALSIGPKMKDLFETFSSNGETFSICGWKAKNHKYPLIAKNESGKSYKFQERYAYKIKEK